MRSLGTSVECARAVDIWPARTCIVVGIGSANREKRGSQMLSITPAATRTGRVPRLAEFIS